MDDQAPQMPPPDERPQKAEDPVPNPHRTEPLPQAEEGTRDGIDPAVRPHQDEEVGPLEGLLTATSAEVSEKAGDVVGDDDPEAESLLAQMGVESENIESGQLLGLVAATLAAVVSLAVILIYLFYVPFRAQTGREAESAQRTTDLDIVRTEGAAKLQYGRIDSTYSVPIGRAMGLVVAEYGTSDGTGLPDSRQEWNTLPVMRGMGDAVQDIDRAQIRERYSDPAMGQAAAGRAVEEVGVDNEDVPTITVIDPDAEIVSPITRQ